MRHKRIILTVCLLLAVSIIIILCFEYTTQIKRFFGYRELEITTSYGDHFLVKSKENMSLYEKSETYKLYYLSSKQRRTFLLKIRRGEFNNFNHQYKDNHIRAYIINDYIVYARNREDFFKAILIDTADLKQQRSLIPVVKYFLFDVDLDMVELVAENLIKSGDPEVINTFKNYANGEFTVEQKERNNSLELEEFQEFSKKLLQESGIY